MSYIKPSNGKLLDEGLAVGLIFTLVFGVVHFLAMRAFHDKAMSNHALLAAQVAFTGLVGHVLFEYMGWNDWFCQTRT